MLEYFTAAQSAPYDFSHESIQNGGIKYPTKDILRAHHPETGEQVGELHYYPPKRKGGPVTVDDPAFGILDHDRRRGAGSALLDEMERRHPGSRVVWMSKLNDKNKPKPGDPGFNANRDYGLPTDWDAHYPKLPGSIHRGIGISLDPGEAKKINSPGTPAAEQAKLLYRHVEGNGSIGMHWSADPVKPHNFAFRNALDPRTDIPVVLHAETPARKEIEVRPNILRNKGVWPHDHFAGDAEVPVRKRRPVKLTGISWLPDVEHPEADETGWVHHTFGEPMQHYAAVIEELPPSKMGNTSDVDISDYFGGGHEGTAHGHRVAGRGRPRHRAQPDGQAGAGGAPAAPGGGADHPGAQQGRPEAGAVGAGQEGPRPVTFHPGAHKDLKALDKPVQKQIGKVIDALANGEPGLQTHALTQKLSGWYSTKASRGHRIVHRATDDGGIHVGYVGLHDYDKAIRRLTSREPRRWYHGSSRDLSPGQRLEAGVDSDKPDGDHENIWLSRDPFQAAKYGDVYEVEVQGEPRQPHAGWPEHYLHPSAGTVTVHRRIGDPKDAPVDAPGSPKIKFESSPSGANHRVYAEHGGRMVGNLGWEEGGDVLGDWVHPDYRDSGLRDRMIEHVRRRGVRLPKTAMNASPGKGPLPINPGKTWYRLHYRPRPWSDASSAELSPYDPTGKVRVERTRQPGFSAGEDPHDLHAYLDDMGWYDHMDEVDPEYKNHVIVQFPGKSIGTGRDGEDLVEPGPRADRVEIPIREFRERLKETPTAYEPGGYMHQKLRPQRELIEHMRAHHPDAALALGDDPHAPMLDPWTMHRVLHDTGAAGEHGHEGVETRDPMRSRRTAAQVCPACQGRGEDGRGRECGPCDGSGRNPECPCGQPVEYDPLDGWQHADGSVSHDGRYYGRSVSDLMKTAVKPRPTGKLPQEEGLYWRLHRKGRPFSRQDATSQVFYKPDEPYESDFDDPDDYRAAHEMWTDLTSAKPGYSSYASPHHVEQYAQQRNLETGDSDVVAFHGKQVGYGNDDEPLVMPHHDKPFMRMPYREFQRRLRRTKKPWNDLELSEDDTGGYYDEDGLGGYFGMRRTAEIEPREASRTPINSREDYSAFIERHYGPNAGESGRWEAHPRSGHRVRVGEHRSLSRPEEGQDEGPVYWNISDYGDTSPQRPLFPRQNIRQDPVEHVYRGVSTEEWQQAQQRGYLRSDQRGTIADWEGTNAATDPRSAVSYLPNAGSGHVLKIRVHPDEQWFTIPHDEYVRTRERIPIERVEHVSPLIHKDERTRLSYEASHPRPKSRVFGPTYGLDHRLFTGEKLKPEVRTAVLARLGPVIEPLLGEDWKRYTKVYLAGSEASEWTSETLEGNGDFDTLIGVDYDHIGGEPGIPVAGMDDDDINDLLNKALRENYNASPWKAPFGGDWDLTGYCNAGSYDIRRIKPYAAYNITDDEWSVRPPHLPDWSIEKLPEGGDNLLAEAEGYAAVIEAISKMPEPFRTQQGKALWKHLHSDRGRAFSDEGEGWLDPGNLIEKALVEWGLWDKLVEWQYGKKTAAYDGPPVEHVRVDKLLPHREWQHQRGGFSYDMEGDGPYAGKHDAESWDANKRSVAEQGIQHPLTLEYNPTTHSAYLGEGNHRLHWAHELGHETVPVRMWRTSKDMPERYRIQGEPKLTKDENGYFPQDGFKPSDVLPADYFPSRKTASWEGREINNIHRGMGVDLPEDLHAYVHDSSIPRQQRAQRLLEHVSAAPFGMHWTDDPDVARGFASRAARKEHLDEPDEHSTPVVVHAEGPELEHIETDKQTLRKRRVRSYDDDQDAESEVPIKAGAPVNVVAVSWADPASYRGGRHKFQRSYLDESVQKTAGARGDLPDLTFKHLPPEDNHSYGGADQDTHTLHAYTRDGKHAGELSWFGEDGMIRDVGVHPDYRRRGIASELLHRARQIQPDVHHSDALTSDGAGWARKVSMLEYFAVKRSDHPLAPDLPQEQHDALDTENWSEHKRKMLDLAKNPVPGTHIWRGEVRAQEPVKSARETGVGIHWGVNPDTILRPKAHDGEHEVVYHAEIEHPGEQNFSRSHSMWHGRHMSLDSEAEVRLKPGTKVKLHGVWYSDPYVSDRGPFTPTKPERMGKQWSYTPIGEHVEVAHRPTTGLIDYSDVGVKHEGVLRYFTAGDDDYRMQHRPADEEYGAPLHDLTHNGMLPDDVYTHPQYYDYGGEGMGSSFGESYRHILRTRGNPEAKVRIYRSLPAEHAHQGFRPGDWVSTSKEYARKHGRQADPKHDWPVISTTVPAKHLWTEGSDLREYGYTGPHKEMPMVSYKGGYHQEIRTDPEGWIKVVKRRKPKTASAELEMRTRKGRRKGIGHTTITAYSGDAKAGHIRMTEGDTEVDDLHVVPAMRGKGVARALMNEVIDRFGHQPLRLHASPFGRGGLDRDALMGFYASHGFEPEEDRGRGYMVRYPGTTKTAMPAKRYPPPEGFSHHIDDLDSDDNDYAKQEEDWPGWNHRILYGKIDGRLAGHIVFSENPGTEALSVGKMETYRNHQGKGLASAMQDALVEEHPRHWINHGSRTGAGQSWWESYDDPAPDRNIHNFPREQWERDFEVPGGHGEEFDRKFGTDERPENQEGAQESRPEPSRPRPQRRVRSVWGSSVAHLSPQDHADSLMSPTREHANKVLQGMGPVKWAEHHSHAERDAISSLDEARTTSRPGTKPVGVLVRKQGDQITGVQLKHHGGDLPEGHMFAGIDIPGFGAIHDLSDDPRPVRKQASMSDYFGMAA